MPKFITDMNQVEKIDGITYEFPYTMHTRNLADFTVPWHWHEELEFDYVMEGAITIDTVNGSYTIQEGDGYFINTNVMNSKRKADNSVQALECAHLFHPILLSGHFQSIFEREYMNPIMKNERIEMLVITSETANGQKYLSNLKKLTKLNALEKQEFQIRNLLAETWLILSDEITLQLSQNALPKQHKQDSVRSMLSFVHQNFDKDITLHDVAAYGNVSDRECSRLFKEIMRKSVFEYILNYRIETAKKLLITSDQSITEIAISTGFNNTSYFTKQFKAITRITPGEYRKKHL